MTNKCFSINAIILEMIEQKSQFNLFELFTWVQSMIKKVIEND